MVGTPVVDFSTQFSGGKPITVLLLIGRVGKGDCCVDPTQDVSGPFNVFVWRLGFPLHVNKKELVLSSSIYFFNHEIFVNLPCEVIRQLAMSVPRPFPFGATTAWLSRLLADVVPAQLMTMRASFRLPASSTILFIVHHFLSTQ